MAFAIAASADEARGQILRLEGFYNGNDLAKEPEEHDLNEKFAAYVFGGS